MSQNVDFVLASYEWGNRERRFPRDFWHPDGEYVNSLDDPGLGAESGIPFEMQVGHVVTLDDGKIRRLEVYLDPAEALEAAGLSE
jgi:hypothetical protein